VSSSCLLALVSVSENLSAGRLFDSLIAPGYGAENLFGHVSFNGEPVPSVLAAPDGRSVVLHDLGGVGAIVEPVGWELLSGPSGTAAYDSTTVLADGVVGHWAAVVGGVALAVTDEWTGGDVVRLRRRVTATGPAAEAVRVELVVPLTASAEPVRYLVPGMVGSPDQWARAGRYGYADHRLAYPIAAAVADGAWTWLARTTTARTDAAPERDAGASRFAQATAIGSCGFDTSGAGALVVSWPYAEADRSSMIAADGRAAIALHPVHDGVDVVLDYELGARPADGPATAMRGLVARMLELADPAPTALPIGYEASIDLRLDSAARTYQETASGFAGFALNFDPLRGYDSEPLAFGASFAEHAMGGSHHILEYGFTGRQLDLAFRLAQRDPAAWAERGRRVVGAFVERMTDPSGWVATLYDLAADEPVFACGDRRGPVMHYLGRSEIAGTYTRMMCEAGSDLLRNVELHESLGADASAWRAAAAALAGFLLRTQEADGAWFRAYAPDGTPIAGGDWFGDRETGARSATGVVVPFLLDARAVLGDPDGALLAAAHRAGAQVLAARVAPADYRGGTLDNPNLVDKEAAFIAMRALLRLAEADEAASPRLLPAALEAAWFAVSWHSLWEVPVLPGTPVGIAGVRSVGWGGINSVWGVGVTDIYSLFFAGDLVRLGARTGEPALGRIAELIAASSLQLLSTPAERHGFADTGMQPEGMSFCAQGVDDGLIAQGDIWGGLGWPYTAGTAGLHDFLAARPDARGVDPQHLPSRTTK
jgi:hypothetical protein